MKRLIAILLAFILMLSMFAGCAQDTNSGAEADASTPTDTATDNNENTDTADTADIAVEDEESDTITIVDHEGVSVELPKQLDRVVVASLNPMPSLLALFLGSGETIVGMNSTSYGAISNGIVGELFPEILEADTSFYQGNAVNIEQLLLLDPQVVIITTGTPELRQTIENAGIPCVAFGVTDFKYNIVDTFENWVDLLCDIYPANENVLSITDYSNEVIDMVAERVATIPEEEIKDTLFLFQYSDSTIRTSGNNFFGQYWCEISGSNNVAGGVDGSNVEITMEQIFDWQPDNIFISNFTTAMPDDLYNNTIRANDWPLVKAVQDGEVHKMPLGSFISYSVSAEMPIVLLWMAQQSYPTYFEDIDVVQEMVDFYDMAFNITITQEQAKSMFFDEE